MIHKIHTYTYILVERNNYYLLLFRPFIDTSEIFCSPPQMRNEKSSEDNSNNQ